MAHNGINPKLSGAYDKARTGKPVFKVSVYHSSTMDGDEEYRKRRRKELEQQIKDYDTKLKNFDRDKAADTVLSSLMRAKKQAELDLDSHNARGDSSL